MDWNGYEEITPKVNTKKVTEPPCRFCKYFKPNREIKDFGSVIFINLRLCHAEEMFGDFSCFELKG